MHAENVQSAVRRLTQKPMDISPAYIPLMNIVMSVQRVHLVKNGEKRAYRRVLAVNEIVENLVPRNIWEPSKSDAVFVNDFSGFLREEAAGVSDFFFGRNDLCKQNLKDAVKDASLHWVELEFV